MLRNMWPVLKDQTQIKIPLNSELVCPKPLAYDVQAQKY